MVAPRQACTLEVRFIYVAVGVVHLSAPKWARRFHCVESPDLATDNAMRYFPVFLDLDGRTVPVLGTGEVGLRKAASPTVAGALARLQTVSTQQTSTTASWRSAQTLRKPT